MPAPKIINRGDDKLFACTQPVAAATQIKPGWFVNLEGGTTEAMDLVTEDAVFAGIAATGHEPNVDNHDTVTIYEQCVVEVDATAAAYVRGEGLQYAAGSGDTVSVVDDAAADTIGWVAEDAPAGSTRIKMLIDVFKLAKLKGEVNA